MKKTIKKSLEDLPFKIGAASLAILFGLGEGIFGVLGDILEGPGRLNIGKAYKRRLEAKTFWDYYEEIKNLKENSLRTAIWRLQKKGLIEKKENQYNLTALGMKYFKKMQTTKVWDGKWRIVMFDIPEKKKKERNWIRNQLYGLGYRPFQKSVFIGKFPISEDLFKDIDFKSLRNNINIITVGEIDNEKILNF